MAVETASPPAAYSPEKGVKREAQEDATRIRQELDQNGPEAAARRMYDEVQAVKDPKDREAYSNLLLEELKQKGNQRSILPELALSYGMLAENKDKLMDKTFMNNKYLSEDKITKAYQADSNPVARAMYLHLQTNYEDMKNNLGEGYSRLFEEQINKALAVTKEHAANRRDFGMLITNEKLFNGISGGAKGVDGADKEITRDDVISFMDKWKADGKEGEEFRKKHGITTEADRKKVTDTLMKLMGTFTDDSSHKSDKAGSVLKSGWLSNYMTQESLLRGLGYRTVDEAKDKLPKTVTNERPMPGVKQLDNFDNTKLPKDKGPWTVAHNMLSGQDEHFKNAPGGKETALKDLTKVLSAKDIFINKAGTEQVTPENRQKIIDRLKEINPNLSDWFASRYPATPGEKNNNGKSEKGYDYKDTKVDSTTRSRPIADRMLKDAGLDERSHKILADALGSVWIKNNVDKELLSDKNIEKVRAYVNNVGKHQPLKEWFEKRFPKDGGK